MLKFNGEEVRLVPQFPNYGVTKDGTVISYRQDASGREVKGWLSKSGKNRHRIVCMRNDTTDKSVRVDKLVDTLFGSSTNTVSKQNIIVDNTPNDSILAIIAYSCRILRDDTDKFYSVVENLLKTENL